MSLKIDDQVKIKFSTLTGTVKGAAVDNTTLVMQYLVEYSDKDGEAQSRYFAAEDIEAV